MPVVWASLVPLAPATTSAAAQLRMNFCGRNGNTRFQFLSVSDVEHNKYFVARNGRLR
jgi:hypothetical protein